MARQELTRSKALEYRRASKKKKGVILDRLVEDTGWSRDNARRQLRHFLNAPVKKRRPKSLKYSVRSRQILANAWILSGCACSSYFVAQISDGVLGRLISHKELKDGPKNSGALVMTDDGALAEVLQMSPATIDRYLRRLRKELQPLARSTTKTTWTLRNEIPFGKSYERRIGPGYLSTDTVAHCGSTLKGEHLWTLNSTDTYTGWTETVTVKNRAKKWIVQGHDEILESFPFKVIAVNYDGGSEFINREMINYAKMHDYQMTRSRPYHSNDNAHIEQKNGAIVRKYAFRFRYEGKTTQDILNALWYWVNLRKNYLVPTRKCIGHTKTNSGRTHGVYDKPKTPYRRVMESMAVSAHSKVAITRIYKGLNDAKITRQINQLQQVLIEHIRDPDMIGYINEVVKAAKAA